MRHVCLLHSQSGWTDEAFVLWILTREGISHECALRHDPLPCLFLPLSGLHDLEHFVIRHRLDFRDGDLPLSGLLLALLLDRVAQHLGPAHTLTVQQVGGNGTLRNCLVVGVLVVALVVHRDGLSHGGLFLVPPLVVQLGSDPMHLLREFGPLVHQPGLLLALAFIGVKATAVKLAVAFHVLVLRHFVVVVGGWIPSETEQIQSNKVKRMNEWASGWECNGSTDARIATKSSRYAAVMR
mmetsp:Transcript_14315/g.40729  ORF Transcript_14315/g.40729 Transcript_14315/m.40729 type:complete len:239 (-) Transcript_14315:20-736(-)